MAASEEDEQIAKVKTSGWETYVEPGYDACMEIQKPTVNISRRSQRTTYSPTNYCNIL